MPDVTQLICTAGINLFRKCLQTDKMLHCQKTQVESMFSFYLCFPRGRILQLWVHEVNPWFYSPKHPPPSGIAFTAFLHVLHNVCDKNISGPCSFWPPTSSHHISDCFGLVMPKSSLVTLWPRSPPGDQAQGFQLDLCPPAVTTVGHFHFILWAGN